MAKRIAILGSTGSIGRNALRVIESLGGEYEVAALSANTNVELLGEQVRRFRPKFAAITNSDYAEQLGEAVGDSDCEVLSGAGSLEEIAKHEDVDCGCGGPGCGAIGGEGGQEACDSEQGAFGCCGRAVDESSGGKRGDDTAYRQRAFGDISGVAGRADPAQGTDRGARDLP